MGIITKIGSLSLLGFTVYLLGVFPWLRGPEKEIQPYKLAPAISLPRSSMVLLNGGEKIGEGILIGSESLPIYNGVLYTGLHAGNIVSVKDGKITNVTLPCGSLPDEPCRRPWGMRFDKNGVLYVADAIAGVYSVDVQTGTVKTVVDASTKIEGLPLLFVNDLDVASDGSIFFSDLSTVATQDNFWKEILGRPSGRLIKYDPNTKSHTVLLKNIQGANGVTLSPDEEFVLVNEIITGRVLRYYLKGPKTGQSDIFVDGLPGMIDNIRPNGLGGVRVFFFSSRWSTEFFMDKEYLRKIVYRFSSALDLVRTGIPTVFPHASAETVSAAIPRVEMFLTRPSSILAVDLDWQGNVTRSYHCTDGSVMFVSEMAVLNDHVYAASPFLPYMTRVRKDDDMQI